MKEGDQYFAGALDTFSYTFPAIRGIQAGKEYYVTMCPLRLIPKLFLFDEGEVPTELRAQRTLNHSRVPAIANYIVKNPKDYVFSSITASIDGRAKFKPLNKEGVESKMGVLVVPMDARFIINDGQHRRAAIESALEIMPELGFETISVVFFIDSGLKKSQQMFSDLNIHAVRPTRSIGILYDHRDPFARLVLRCTTSVDIFRGLTELEKTTISNRSIKMFTLSGIYQATESLVGTERVEGGDLDEVETLCRRYWTEVTNNIPEWRLLVEKRVSSSELRKDFVHAHGVALHALGIAGNALINEFPSTWEEKLKQLGKIDWSRSNGALWEGRAMIGGRINKSQANLILTANVIKKSLGLNLNPEEAELEGQFKRSKRSR